MSSASDLLAAALRLGCGVRQLPADALPTVPCVFFANHSSHLDFATLWAALPPASSHSRDSTDRSAAPCGRRAVAVGRATAALRTAAVLGRPPPVQSARKRRRRVQASVPHMWCRSSVAAVEAHGL